MMESNSFDSALRFVAFWEGGEVDDLNDPGGHTNLGVTQNTLNIARAKRPERGLPKFVSQLNAADARFIYHEFYWLPIQCHRMQPAVALMVFDGCVNQGVTAMSKHLQKAVGASVDGIVGSKTLAALEERIMALGTAEVLRDIAAERALGYAHTGGLLGRFGRGWYRRLIACFGTALSGHKGDV